METRRSNLIHADPQQVGERGSRDVSPQTGTRRKEEEWRREKARDREPDAWGWNREREVSFSTFKARDGEMERAERERRRDMPRHPNGRLVSVLEQGAVLEWQGERGKGDTFPRMRRPSKEKDRKANIVPEHEKRGREREMERGTDRIQERQGRMEPCDSSRERDREMAWKRDRDIQRYREEERRRAWEKVRLIEDWKRNVQKSLEREERRREEARECDPSSQERRRDMNTQVIDPRGRREMDRERGRQRPSDRAFRFYSPQRQRVAEEERGMDRIRRVNRDGREYIREGQRDTRSEGESDGGRGNVREREENSVTPRDKHSKSEGDNERDERRARAKQRQKDKEREREAEYFKQREQKGDTGKNRDAYYDQDRLKEREKETEMVKEKQRDEFSKTQRRGKDDRSGRNRGDGRPYPREDVGQPKECERLAERHTYPEREREQRRPREREAEREDRLSHSPSSTQFGTQPKSQSSGEWMSGSDLESERRRRGARDGTEGMESGRESTPEVERERRRQRKQDFYRPPSAHKENKVPNSQKGEEGESSKRGCDERETQKEISRTGVDQDQKGAEKSETKTMRRMWLVPGSGRAEKSRESSQEEEVPERKKEMARDAEMVSERLEDKYRRLEKAGEFMEERGRNWEGEDRLERRDGEGESESESTNEREANVTEESDKEREDGSDSAGHLGSEGLSDGEIMWRVSPSVEEGFVTVSSGGDDDEDNFEDCKEFWDGVVQDDATRQSHRVHEKERGVEGWEERRTKSEIDKGGTVFCVVGNKLPRKESNKRAYLDLDNLESVRDNQTEYSDLMSNNRRSLDLTGDRKPKQEPPLSNNGDHDEGVEYECATATTNVQETEEEPERQTLSNEHMQEEMTSSSNIQTNTNSTPEVNPHPPIGTGMPGGFEDYGYTVIQDRKQEPERSLEQAGGEVNKANNQTEEIWTTAEEMKRHSQAPHLKWAKNVVQEILGISEAGGQEEVSGVTKIPSNPNQVSEGTEGLPKEGPMPVYTTVQKRSHQQDKDSEPLPPPEESVDWEDRRGIMVHAGNLTLTDVHAEKEVEVHGNREIDMHEEGDKDAGTDAQTDTGICIYVEEKVQELSTGEKEGSDSKVEAEPISQSRDSSVERETREETQGGEDRMRTVTNKREKCILLSTNSFRDLGTEARLRRRGFRKTVEKGKPEEVEEDEEGEGEGRDRRTRVFHNSEDENDDMRFSWTEVELRKVVDSIGRTNRRNSKFFNSQLYQQYSEVVLNREILRQAHSDTLPVELPATLTPSSVVAPTPSPAQRPLPPLPTVAHPHSLQSSGSFCGTPTLPVPALPHRPSSPRLSISAQTQSLWQELPSVRNSDELEAMSEDQRRLQEVRFEVVTSEASYSRSLDIVVEQFVKSKDLGTLLTTQDRNWLFSRLADVRAISHSFLTKLEERVENDTLHFDVCDIITRHCQMFRMVYVPYLTNQSYQDKTYQRLMDENPNFKRCVDKLERSPVCQRLPLRSFLILPFQRITRLKLLVQNIVKRTAPKSEDEAQAIKAMKLLEKIIQESNDSITQMKSIESLVCLSAKVDFECKTLPLISQSRRMVREGLVTELMDFSSKETERTVYMHLFNDYLLLSLPKEGGRFTVIDHAPMAELRAENCRVKLHSLKKNLFRLHLFRKSLLLRTDTLSDKLRWISAVSSPHPEIDFTAAQDFPQMQCIRAYVAQQPDELSLEKADVLLVHQHSSDGWVEGTRMSDRHRGWAPDSHLETITNEKARQCNLMDIHKITTATAAL